MKARSIVSLVVLIASAAIAGSAQGAEELSAKDLAKEFGRLRYHRFYRSGSSVLENVTRYAQMDPAQIPPADRFLRAFYEGRWDEVQSTLVKLPETLPDTIYDKMLDDMTGRNVPLVTLDDFLGLTDACPTALSADRIRKLGQVLRAAVPKEQELWLRKALEKGSRLLGRDDAKKLVTGRILLHANFDECAREYLPSASEATQLEDEQARDEILNFLASQEELESFQQTRIAGLWKKHAAALSDPNADASAQQQALDKMTELLAKAPSGSIDPWLRSLATENAIGLLRLATQLGKVSQTKIGDSDVPGRVNNLRAQKTLLVCAADRAKLSEAPWSNAAIAMADWWLRECDNMFAYHPKFRTGGGSRPFVGPMELLETAPEGVWGAALPASLRERIDLLLSRLVMLTDRYEDAVGQIVEIAKRNPKAGAALAEEYLSAWADRHDPQIPADIRKKHQLPEDAKIVVTPIMMEKNIDSLARMMDLFRKNNIRPRNAEVLVGSFAACYSNAEVYRRTHIEKVFGSIPDMDDAVFLAMIQRMTEGLSSRWRKLELQKEEGTRRTQEETLAMVRDGYGSAMEMIDQRVQKHPDAWQVLVLAGSLLSDWADFEYYQELVAETNTKRMEHFREKNNQAEDRFVKAAEAYAGELAKSGRGVNIDVYLAWFHSLLGINSSGDVNLSKPLDRPALNKIREAVRSLPGDAAKAHLDRFARHVSSRMEDTEKPLHEELKYKYLAGSLVITKESPFSFEANNKVNYFDELLNEIRLETRVDGPSTVHRDQAFGILLTVRHSEAMGRMADFGKYLVNEAPTTNQFAPSRKLAGVPTVYRMGQAQGRRDELELNIRESLGLFFDIKSITFSPRDVQPRPTDQPGWQETVLAYVYAKAKDSSVDKIPRIQMSLEFMDMTGPVKISAESPETMIKVTDVKTPPRPFTKVDLVELLDARTLPETEEALLEITATASGLVPELEDLLDLEALKKQLPVARIDPHEGTLVRQVNSWGETIHPVSERRWTVVLDASSLMKPAERIKLALPGLKAENSAAKYQAYVDMDLVDLAEPAALVGPTAGQVIADALEPTVNNWLPYVIGGGIAAALVAIVAVAVIARGRRERPLRARDVFHMPSRIDGFVVVQLLRALGSSDLVRLNESQRRGLREEIDKLQKSCFENGSGPSEDELRGVARKWLKIAC